jgi:hypothetical protein
MRLNLNVSSIHPTIIADVNHFGKADYNYMIEKISTYVV